MALSGMIEPYLLMIMASSVVIFTVIIIAVEYDWSVKSLLHKLKPERSTPLQKEIKAERKEIAKLKQHKRDMEELGELKKQKDQLWEDVHEEEHSKFEDGDPLPHLKNIQRNELSDEYIRYIAMKKQSEHFEEIIRETEEFKKRHTKGLTRCPDCGEVAMSNYPEVEIGENGWRYLYYCNNCPAKY